MQLSIFPGARIRILLLCVLFARIERKGGKLGLPIGSPSLVTTFYCCLHYLVISEGRAGS